MEELETTLHCNSFFEVETYFVVKLLGKLVFETSTIHFQGKEMLMLESKNINIPL